MSPLETSFSEPTTLTVVVSASSYAIGMPIEAVRAELTAAIEKASAGVDTTGSTRVGNRVSLVAIVSRRQIVETTGSLPNDRW